MIDLSKYRIVDLSGELMPGKEARRLEIREYVYEPDNTFMHDIDLMSHIGPHIEGPSHYKKGLKDVTQIPLEKFIGEAILLKMDAVEPGKPIIPEDLQRVSTTGGVRKGDIVLLHSSYKGPDAPYISRQCAEHLYTADIKMLGIDGTIGLEEPGGHMFTHDFLLGNDIPIIETLSFLDTIDREHFFFIGFPLRIKGLDSSPIRAVALVERSGQIL